MQLNVGILYQLSLTSYPKDVHFEIKVGPVFFSKTRVYSLIYVKKLEVAL